VKDRIKQYREEFLMLEDHLNSKQKKIDHLVKQIANRDILSEDEEDEKREKEKNMSSNLKHFNQNKEKNHI
jgi:SMC interacting uncharacterized protein involved in chromosome segregation